MIKLGLKGSGTLGDALWLTPAIHALKARGEEVTVQMHDDKQCREVATIFDGLCPVEFTNHPAQKLYHINNDDTHYAQRVLNYLGITEVNCIPRIILKEEEINWAREYLKEYKNMCAIVNDNSGCNDPTNYRAHYVRPKPFLIQQQVNDWAKEDFTMIHIGHGDDSKFTPLNGVVQIRGTNIRQLAALYHVIGRIISGDTGSYHLALSVGATALVLSPDENIQLGYIYDELHYKPHLWKNESIRCRYINFNTGKLIYNY